MNNGYLNFDEYIRQGEPQKRERAEAWRVAIGLQAVDGLKTSWYFRNALVRANYRNLEKGINYEPEYLNRFFANLLFGEKWDLRNRYLHIHPTEEWKVQSNLAIPEQVPDKYPDKYPDKLYTANEHIVELVQIIGETELSVKDMLIISGLKNRENFLEYHLNPAIAEGYVCLLYPDKPRHPRQKYQLTMKGMALYNELNIGE